MNRENQRKETNNFNIIVNPESGRKVDINGKIGKRVLKNYVKHFGGMHGAMAKARITGTNAMQTLNHFTEIQLYNKAYIIGKGLGKGLTEGYMNGVETPPELRRQQHQQYQSQQQQFPPQPPSPYN